MFKKTIQVLKEIFAWEQRFIGETHQRFVLSCEPEEFVSRIKNEVEIFPNSFFIWPFDYTVHSGLYGYADREKVKIGLKPAGLETSSTPRFLDSLFGISSIRYYHGIIKKKNNHTVITGTYRLRPVQRYSGIVGLNFMFIFLSISVAAAFYNLWPPQEMDIVLVSGLLIAAAVGTLFGMYKCSRIAVKLTKHNRDTIFEYLSKF